MRARSRNLPGVGYLVASDIDGTLLRSDAHVSDRTKAAIRAFVDVGGHFVYATGRPPRWVTPVAELAEHMGLAICSNGALVIDLATGEELHRRLLDGPCAQAVVRELTARVPGATFAVDAPHLIGHDPAYRPRWPMPPGTWSPRSSSSSPSPSSRSSCGSRARAARSSCTRCVRSSATRRA